MSAQMIDELDGQAAAALGGPRRWDAVRSCAPRAQGKKLLRGWRILGGGSAQRGDGWGRHRSAEAGKLAKHAGRAKHDAQQPLIGRADRQCLCARGVGMRRSADVGDRVLERSDGLYRRRGWGSFQHNRPYVLARMGEGLGRRVHVGPYCLMRRAMIGLLARAGCQRIELDGAIEPRLCPICPPLGRGLWLAAKHLRGIWGRRIDAQGRGGIPCGHWRGRWEDRRSSDGKSAPFLTTQAFVITG